VCISSLGRKALVPKRALPLRPKGRGFPAPKIL